MKKKKPLILIFLAVGAIVWFIYIKTGDGLDVPTITLKRKDLLVTVTSTSIGTVKAEVERQIISEVNARLIKLYHKEGDIVRKGELLAELSDESIISRLKEAEHQLRALELRYNSRELSFNSLQREVDLEIDMAQNRLDDINRKLKKNLILSKKGFVAEEKIKDLEFEKQTAERELEKALLGKEKLAAEERQLKALSFEVQKAKETLKELKRDLSNTRIYADLNGVILEIIPKEGGMVNKGAVIARIADTDTFYVEATIDEADAGRVHPGQDVNLMLDAFPERNFKGRIKWVSPVVLGKRLEARTFRVKVVFLEVPENLKVGMSADMEIIVGRLENALSVPTQVIFERKGKGYVYLVENGRASLKEVQRGLSNWNYTEIKSGLKEGDRVILTPDMPGIKNGIKVVARDEHY